MALPDNVWERLKAALIATDQATDNGRPALTVTQVGSSGVPNQIDDTDKQAVSIYGKGTAAGDTPVLVDANGRVPVVVGAPSLGLQAATATPGAFFTEGTVVPRTLAVLQYQANANSLDAVRNNHEITALASASRSASADSADLTNYNAAGAVFVIDATVLTATTITVTIQGKSTLGTDYYTILVSAVIAVASVVVLRVYPGLLAAANLTVNDVLPRIFRVSVAQAGTTATYSISANVIS